MKKIFMLFIFIISSVFAEDLVITKYLIHKPAISVNFNGDKNILKILKTDLKILDHFDYKFNDSNASFKVNFIYKNKTLKVEYIDNNRLVYVKFYKSKTYQFYPFLVHKAIYDLNKYFNLPDAKFLTKKIIYSLLVAPKESNIYIADYTLTYKKRLITGGLNIFPKWANQNQNEIYYTKLGKYATIYKYNIYTGKRERLLSSPGMAIVSDVKNDAILLTLSPKGLPDIYEYNLSSHKILRITNYPGIDVEGKFWGDKIAFISDRYGIPYVFVKDLNSGVITRVMYQGKNQIGFDTFKNYLVVSVRETDNAFKPNTFNIFLINKNDESLKRLTFKGENMYANFSVDGNSIMFIKRENFFSKIGIIRLNENKIFYFKLSKILQSFDW
jgi:TolB protein